MRKFWKFRISAALIMFLGSIAALSAVDGNFQINTVFQRTTYPLFGTGGKDVLRPTSAGIGLKSTRGDKLLGTIDVAILFPFRIEEQAYPATTFSDGAIDGFPIVLDLVIGIGYSFDLSPLVFLVSGGFHTGSVLEGGDTLVAFGIGIDAQSYVRLGKVLTAQFGLKFAVDFWGTQTFTAGSNELAGFPMTFGFYTGIGLNYR